MDAPHPPLYYTITNRLNGIGERAALIADHLLEESEYKEENRELWIKFCRDHPDDKAAKFMKERLERPLR